MKLQSVVNLRVTNGLQSIYNLSTQTCQMLGLLKLGYRAEVLSLHENYIPPTTHSILQDYRDVFEELGHISCSSFTVDPTAMPFQHTSRQIPVVLWNEVKSKFADLDTTGIIKKETAPTEQALGIHDEKMIKLIERARKLNLLPNSKNMKLEKHKVKWAGVKMARNPT